MTGGSSRTFPISSSPCVIPASAKAYSLNVTVVPQGALGWVTLWPTGQMQPGVSTLNAWDGRVTANAAVVPAGTGGSVNAFVTNTTHVIIDINGYYQDALEIGRPLSSMTITAGPPYPGLSDVTTFSKFLWEPSRYLRMPAEIYLEVVGKLIGPFGSASVRLVDLTRNSTITGSSLTITPGSVMRVRSGNLASSFPTDSTEISLAAGDVTAAFAIIHAALLIAN